MKFTLICLFLALAIASEEPRRLIKGRPDLKDQQRPFDAKLAATLFPGNDTWHADYVSFPASDTTFHFFSWTIMSRNDPVNDPTVFWFTGGPGCSSDLALFAENGPWHFSDPTDPSSIDVNPFSWNARANLVFVDQPVGTGFSYSDQNVYERNEDEVAQDVYAFTQGYYKKYPKLLKNPLFITGESYGGHYVPAISEYIVQMNAAGNNTQIPFAGCAIGNGLVDPLLQYPQYAPFAYSYNLISKFDLEKYALEIKPCIAAVKAGAYGTAYDLCNGVSQGIMRAAGIANPYNIHAGCEVPGLCYQFAAVTSFLNQEDVQKAIGIPNGLQWSSCNFAVNGQFSSDWMHSMADRMLPVLAANKTVLIYSGILDYICNYVGGNAWVNALPWTGASGFSAASTNAWNIALQNGTQHTVGQLKGFQNFAWLEVAGAGHMVPMDQPQSALKMLNRFISQGFRM